jgi:hypothetical protein
MTGLGTEYLNRISGNTVYSHLAKGISKMYAATEKNASDPIVIATLIRKGIEAKCPKTRYVGASGAKMLLFLRKIMSDRMFDRMVMSQMK